VPDNLPFIRREPIAAALYALVCAQAGTVVNLRTSSRRLRNFDSVDPSQMPALFITQRPELQERGAIGLPSKRTMNFEVYLYTADPQADSVIPVQQLNNMVDAIEAALVPNPLTGVQTLGGLVQSARIDGSVEYYENITADNKSVAIIPIAVLVP
jgi:hypothetical protein